MNESIKKHYKNLLEKFGQSPQALQWSDKTSQFKRFEILTQIDKEIKSVIDLGCGFGDLYEFLKISQVKEVSYLGLDFLEEFISIAKKRFEEDDNANFNVFDINQQNLPFGYDYTIISGIFNNKTDANRDFLFKTIQKAFDSCKKGVAFNAMSTYVDFFDDKLFYIDPLEVFDFCKKNITRKVTLRHDYLVKENSIPFEFTIYLYK